MADGPYNRAYAFNHNENPVMRIPDFLFAVIPPALAVLLQYFSLPSDRYIARVGAKCQADNGLPEAVQPILVGLMKGVLAISSVTPTFVSVLVSVYALVYDRTDVAEYVLILLVGAILITVILLYWLSGYAPFELATNKLPFGEGFWRFTGLSVINTVVYLANGALIILAFLKLCGWLPTLHFLH